MVKRSKGLMSTRTKKLRKKQPITISKLVRSFKIGSRVIITPRSYMRGIPSLRYVNREGIVVETRGECYVVEIRDGNKKKQLIAHPVHLEEVK